jgi:hypothetical protein
MPVMNLVDFAANVENPVKNRAIAMSFIKARSVMQDGDVETNNTLSTKGTRIIDLVQTPDWVDLEESLPDIINNPEPWSEQKYLKGFKIKVPRILAESKEGGGLQMLMSKQGRAALAAHSMDMDFRFFNNNRLSTTDTKAKKCFNGLRARLGAAGRAAYKIPTECKISAGGIDIRPSVCTKEGIFGILVFLSNALEIMDREDGEGVVFYANENVWSVLENSYLLTNNSLFGNDTDALGRKIMTYRGAKIKRCSRNVPVSGGTQTYVIPNTEDTTGELIDSSNLTSIFGVAYGKGSFEIEQFKEPDLSDPRLMENDTTYQSSFLNGYGLVQESTRSIIQIHNLRAK